MILFPGTFWHWPLYKDVISFFKPSIFYDGVNSCLWNGGRSNVSTNIWNNTIAEKYYQYGHRIALTFSNKYIDLKDTLGNELLEILSERENYVILRNDELASYIRKKYSKISLIYSIIGTQKEYKKDFYEKILDRYDYVVPRFHHLLHLKTDFKDLSRFEVMINHTCPSTCPYWEKHYSLVEKENLSGKIFSSYDTEVLTCLLREDLTDSKLQENSIKRRLQKALSLGFSRFKLAGREFPRERLKKEIEQVKEFL